MFTPISMGTNRMLGIDNNVPLTPNNFEIRIYNMDGSAPTEFSELLTLSTAEVGEIKEQQETITVHYGNGVIKFPSKVDFQDVDWSLNCFCEPNTLNELRKWRKQVYDWKTEKIGLPSDYMKLVYFIKYDGQGRERDIIKCPGTWIKNLGNGAMNQDPGSSIVRVVVTFVISRADYLDPSEF